jgi:hypothetical protein
VTKNSEIKRTISTNRYSSLFAARIVRLFCYGFLSVVLALYLAQAGLSESRSGCSSR